MQKWLPAALDYIPRWIEFQMRQTETPGCVVAIAAKGDMVLEQAFGVADLGTGTALTALHRFRVASHSKSFTAAAIMKLREAGRLELDDPAGRFVDGLHPTVAEVTLAQLPLGRRLVIPGDNPTHALAAATGFVSTAADLARFFSQLDPEAKQSMLSVASRREMIRRQWRDAYSSVERHYGLGIMCSKTGDLEWFGHGGAFQGFISRTVVVPQHGLAVSIVTNTVERLAEQWSDGALHIISAFARRGAPEKRLRNWSGRWWNVWNALDLVPVGDRVLILTPALPNPLTDASEVEVTGADAGQIALAPG